MAGPPGARQGPAAQDTGHLGARPPPCCGGPDLTLCRPQRADLRREDDLGRLELLDAGPSPPLSDQERGACFGVYYSEAARRTPFYDTCPTW